MNSAWASIGQLLCIVLSGWLGYRIAFQALEVEEESEGEEDVD